MYRIRIFGFVEIRIRSDSDSISFDPLRFGSGQIRIRSDSHSGRFGSEIRVDSSLWIFLDERIVEMHLRTWVIASSLDRLSPEHTYLEM